jgi:ribosomal protein L2
VHAKASRGIIAGGNNSAPVAAAPNRNGARIKAGVIAHFNRRKKAVGVAVNNFSHLMGAGRKLTNTVLKHSIR